jgi:hypothetical protein
MTEDRVRAILTRESEARLALKFAKAEEFTRMIRRNPKARIAEVWQEVALATEDEEREHAAALIEKLVLWYMHAPGAVQPDEPDDDEDVW